MRQGKACGLHSAILVGLLLTAGCGSSDSAAERDARFRALAEASQYEEIQLQIQVLESGGGSGADLDYWMGVALLNQDDDRVAEDRFARAVAADSSLALPVASHYRAAALRDQEEGWRGRGAERMKRAYLLDGVTEMGGLEEEVGDLLFEEKRYPEAIPVYRFLLTRVGDPHEMRWSLRLGVSLEQSGMRAGALEQYRAFWSRFDRRADSVYPDNVAWRQSILLLDFADERMARGDCPGAIKLLDELLELQPSADQRATAYYRKGLCLEDLLRLDEARENYRKVLEIPAGEGGKVHHEARQRLQELADRG